MTIKTMIGKRFAFVIAIICTYLPIIAQRTIIMEKDGGVYKIPCSVNGAKMKFIFDTGAAKVNISLAMAEYLYENGYIEDDDIVGKSQASVASGDIIDNLDIIIRDIEISGMHLRDVHAWVSSSLKAPLLLGQSAIQKLGSITIEGDKLIINNAAKTITSQRRDELEEAIALNLNNKDYFAVIRLCKELETSWGLSNASYAALTISYFCKNQYEECSKVCNRFFIDNSVEKRDIDYLNMYSYYYEALFRIKDYQKSIEASKAGIVYCSNNSKDEYRFNFNLGRCYKCLGDVIQADKYYGIAMDVAMNNANLSFEDITSGRIQNPMINDVCFEIGEMYIKRGESFRASTYLAIGAMGGDDRCLNYCKRYNINYKQAIKSFMKYYRTTSK